MKMPNLITRQRQAGRAFLTLTLPYLIGAAIAINVAKEAPAGVLTGWMLALIAADIVGRGVIGVIQFRAEAASKPARWASKIAGAFLVAQAATSIPVLLAALPETL